jgi:hypothetical protein
MGEIAEDEFNIDEWQEYEEYEEDETYNYADLQEATINALVRHAGWHRIDCVFINVRDYIRARAFARDTCKGKWIHVGNTYIFEKSEDSALFKLKFA